MQLTAPAAADIAAPDLLAAAAEFFARGKPVSSPVDYSGARTADGFLNFLKVCPACRAADTCALCWLAAVASSRRTPGTGPALLHKPEAGWRTQNAISEDKGFARVPSLDELAAQYTSSKDVKSLLKNTQAGPLRSCFAVPRPSPVALPDSEPGALHRRRWASSPTTRRKALGTCMSSSCRRPRRRCASFTW